MKEWGVRIAECSRQLGVPIRLLSLNVIVCSSREKVGEKVKRFGLTEFQRGGGRNLSWMKIADLQMRTDACSIAPTVMSAVTDSPKKSKFKSSREKKSQGKSPNERLKIAVRRLPPNLPEEIFWQSVSEWVSDKTVSWKTFYPGKVKKRYAFASVKVCFMRRNLTRVWRQPEQGSNSLSSVSCVPNRRAACPL